jgi:uroporphyrinogen decarboxylase
MNSREIILDVIRSKQVASPARVPVALLSGGTWAFRQKGLTLQDVLHQPNQAGQILVDVNKEVQSDIVWPGSGYHNIPVQFFGGEIKFRQQGNIDVVKPAFETLSAIDHIDLDVIDHHVWSLAIRDMISQVDAQIGHSHLVGTSSWGPFTLAGQFYGVEKMLSGLYKDKAGIHALLEVITEVVYRYLSPTIARGAAILSLAEPTASGDLISLHHFEEFVVPYLAKLIGRLKKAGALITLHICGNIQDRISLAPELGVDLLSVDYKVDLAQAAQDLKGQVALAGNLNPVLLKECLPEELVKITRQILARAAGYNRFILMPGCDVPPAVPLKNVKTFLRTGLDWKNK